MNAEEYTENMNTALKAIQQAGLFLSFLSEDDLMLMQQTVSKASALGPFVDPTMYQAALGDKRLEYQREVLDLCLHIKHSVERLKAYVPGR